MNKTESAIYCLPLPVTLPLNSSPFLDDALRLKRHQIIHPATHSVSAPAEEQCSTAGYGSSPKREEGTGLEESMALLAARPQQLATVWLLQTDDFTLASLWVNSLLVNLPSPGCTLSNKKIPCYLLGWKDIWGNRPCNLLLLWCNTTTQDNLKHKNLCITIPQTHHRMLFFFFCNSPFKVFILIFYSLLPKSFDSYHLPQAQLSMQYTVQMETFSCFLLSKPKDLL